MMRLGRRASLLGAFSLLTSAATAHGECAWVLWMERPTHSNQWSLSWTRGAFETKKECDQAARIGSEVEAKALVEAQKRRLTPKPSALYTCLPDTVDPRGPKGK